MVVNDIQKAVLWKLQLSLVAMEKTYTKYRVRHVKQISCNYNNPHFKIPSYPTQNIVL